MVIHGEVLNFYGPLASESTDSHAEDAMGGACRFTISGSRRSLTEISQYFDGTSKYPLRYHQSLLFKNKNGHGEFL